MSQHEPLPLTPNTGQSLTATAPPRARRVYWAIGLALAILIGIELAAQVRSQLRFGQSIFNLLAAETLYTPDPATGLNLLRPNRVFTGSEKIIRSNSLGLRSPEPAATRPPGSLRLAVLGASTVMGAYAADNDRTFSALLQQRLAARFPGRQIEVINAGIVGYTLADQTRMLDRRLAPLRPDLVIVYPGFNDFAGYCRETPKARFIPQSVPKFTLPGWLLSQDLLLKNTGFLRTLPVRAQTTRDPDQLDLAPYRTRLRELIATARGHGLSLVLASNSRAYRPEQPRAEQLRLSETARYYNSCFDLEGLHRLYDRHNRAIAEEAEAARLPFLALDRLVPGGARYFADASHFSAEGEALVAERIERFLLDRGLLQELGAP